MRELEKIKNHILYGSLTKNIYYEAIPLLVKENNDNLSGLSIITFIFGGLLSIASYFGILSRIAFPAYMFLFLSSVFFIVFRRLVNQDNRIVSYLTCISQCIALMTFGLLNSSAFSPDLRTNGTIFPVLLLVVPFLIVDLPYRMDFVLIVTTAVYCIMIRIFKDPNVITLDTTNAVTVCLVSCMCNWIFASKNMQSVANRLYIEKERDSDALTGLLTKQAAKIITETHLSNGRKGVFMIIDLDNFKYVNDTFGHLYGDEVLKKVANCIKGITTRTDVAARFGGDEFTIFFPDAEMDTVKEKADSFYKALKDSFADEKHYVTCSVGMTSATSKYYDKLFEIADQALYKSKENGKNRYTIAG